MTDHLRVNPIMCDGHGLCAELFPERVTLDDWGFPIIDERPLTRELVEHARRAIDACPTLALAIIHAGGGDHAPVADEASDAARGGSQRRAATRARPRR